MQPTHDPPAAPQGAAQDTPDTAPFQEGVAYTDAEVVMPRAVRPPGESKRHTDERAKVLASPIYRLLAAELGEDPLDLVRAMVGGRYRYRRDRAGRVMFLEPGVPRPECMSFRTAEVELVRLTGGRISVTYETLRRWWEKVWPQDDEADAVSGHGDDRARVQQAQDDARAVHTNVSVPPAAFLPPDAA